MQLRELPVVRATSRILIGAERIIFALVGLLLFFAAVALAYRSVFTLISLYAGPEATLIDTAAQFLDIILLILMIAEIAYTVTLSVRVGLLSPEPFLIVGLIAVIRRILVITVQEVNPPVVATASIPASSVEVGILTLVVMAFVFAIYLLRRGRRQRRP
jgi:hypothetical protein